MTDTSFDDTFFCIGEVISDLVLPTRIYIQNYILATELMIKNQ